MVMVILFETAADVFSKEWSLKPQAIFLIGSISLYLAANVAWLLSLRDGAGLARGVSIFSVTTAIMAVVIGFLFFREEVNRLQMAGIVLGIVALVLIFWHDIFH